MAGKPAFTVAEMANAIREAAGIKTAAARRLGCHMSTVDNYIERYPTVREAYEQARVGIIDMAESILIGKLNAREWDAAKFVLTTIGKDRGWGQSVDVSQTGDITIRVQYGDRDDSA